MNGDISDDALDEKLARLTRRVQGERSAVRDAVRADPELVACIQALKATFGVRIVGYWSDSVRYGDEAQFSRAPEPPLVKPKTWTWHCDREPHK